jgi:hypothetical protein
VLSALTTADRQPSDRRHARKRRRYTPALLPPGPAEVVGDYLPAVTPASPQTLMDL